LYFRYKRGTKSKYKTSNHYEIFTLKVVFISIASTTSGCTEVVVKSRSKTRHLRFWKPTDRKGFSIFQEDELV